MLSCGDTKEQQCNALHAALLNPAIQPVAKSVIMNIVKSDNWTETKIGSDDNASSEINNNQCLSNDAKGLSNIVMNNFKKLICHVKGTNGRWSNVAEQFIRTVFTAISGGGSKTLDGFSDCVIEDVFGLTARTVKRRFVKSTDYWEKIFADDPSAYKIIVKGKRLPKITEVLEDEIIKWVKIHENVRQSPCTNDTLQINGQTVPKLLLEISVADLHKDLASSGIPGILDKKTTSQLENHRFTTF